MTGSPADLEELLAHCKRTQGWSAKEVAAKLGVSYGNLMYRKRNKSRNSKLWCLALVGLIATAQRRR